MVRDKTIIIASAASRKSLGISYSLKRVLKARIVGLFHTIHPYIFSKVFDKVVILRASDEQKFLLEVLEYAVKNDIHYILPIRFIDVYYFSRHKQLFKKHDIEIMAPDFEMVELVSTRTNLSQIFKGIAKVPRQIFIYPNLECRDIEDLLGDLNLPLVVKGISDQSKPAFHILRKTALSDAISRKPCVVEEYVPGIARGYYAVSWKGKPLLEYTHQRIIEEYPVGGPSIAARGPIGDPKLIDIGRRFLRRLQWSGPVMIETKWDPDTGEYTIIEVNPKFWGSIDLPVSQNYHFPAVYASIYLYDIDFAEKLVSRLPKEVTQTTYSWVLDGLSYIVKMPIIWIKLINLVLNNGLFYSDLYPIEPLRWIGTILEKIIRLRIYRYKWTNKLENSGRNIISYIKNFMECLYKSEKVVLALDLDGTLVKIPINWKNLRRRLILEEYMHPWENIRTMLVRLWLDDRKSFKEVSKIIEEEELQATKNMKILISESLIRQLFNLGIDLYVVTLQSRKAAQTIIKNIRIDRYIRGIISRDDETGPLKLNMYQNLRINSNTCYITIDDDLKNLIEAIRKGYIVFKAPTDSYRDMQAILTGIPVVKPLDVLNIVIKSRRKKNSKSQG